MYQDHINKVAALSSQNKYFFWWKSIIERATTRGSKAKAKKKYGYVEGHHIFPISFGADKTGVKYNIVYLTAKEHIMVHRLMCKFLSGEHKIKSLRAFNAMCRRTKERRISIHHASVAKRNASEAKSIKTGIKGVPEWFVESDDVEVFKTTLSKLCLSGVSDPDIAKMYNVSSTAIHNWRKKLGIKNRRENLRSKNYLTNEYISNNKSCGQIAKELGCTSSAVQQYLKKFGIEVRCATDRQRLRSDRTILTSEVITDQQKN